MSGDCHEHTETLGGYETPPLVEALDDVARERLYQDAKWGVQDHTDLHWYAILGEEFGECGTHLCPFEDLNDEELDKEIIQVAAVAVAWLESRRRQRG